MGVLELSLTCGGGLGLFSGVSSIWNSRGKPEDAEPLGGGRGEHESQDQLDAEKGEQYQNESV